MGLFGKKNTEKTIAIFDIGSGGVGGALVHVSSNEKSLPTILKSVRTEIASRDELDYNLFLADMLKALDTTAVELYKSKTASPKSVSCIMASPWYLSETRVIKISRDHSFVFTQKIADDLLKKEVDALSEEYKKRYGDINVLPEVIEHHIMGVSLNGYPVADPIGKRSKSLEMNMITSLSPKLCLDKIKETVNKTFPHTKVSFSSFIVDSYFVARDRFSTLDSYILINIGGEITDVGIVSGGMLKASLSFPFGKKTFYKNLYTNLGIEMRDAQELFSLFMNNTLDENRKARIALILKSIEDLWGESFRQCVNTLPHTFTLPGTIFLTVDSDLRKWFTDVVCNQEYVKTMVTGRKCTVIAINGPEYSNMCNYKDNECDPFLMVEAIAMARKIER